MKSAIGIPRPLLRYHGGKWILGKWISTYLPKHRVYVEPYCGAASVLLNKERSYAEVLNDLDQEIVNLFRVMRSSETANQLVQLLHFTPFSRVEFLESYEIVIDDPVEQARRTIIKAFMGFGSNAIHRRSGFRADSNRSGTTPAHDWANYAKSLPYIVDRLRGVVVENKPALDIVKQFNRGDCLLYVDPPYVKSTRDKGKDYTFEMSDEDHEELCDRLLETDSMVVLSGYQNEIYAEKLNRWVCVMKQSLADGARPRTECLWLSPSVSYQLQAAA